MRRLVVLCIAVFNYANGQLVWQLNSVVSDLAVGPEDAVHCRLTSPRGITVFDGFGQCRVNIDRVTEGHGGIWTMDVNQPDNVLPAAQTFTAQVTPVTVSSKAPVSTEVLTNKPLVQLSCRVASPDPVVACVFRNPAGRVLQARSGVTEDRYSFVESSQTGVHSCGLQINEPLTSDLGLWRCDMQTASETYYGHLSVLCPFAMQDPETAASVISEPTLTSQTNDIVVFEGHSVKMSCSVQSAIRYCYFRARNGTIFNVSPGTSSPGAEYAGAGLDAGECGARFTGLLRSDSGNWSCHVGFPDSDAGEQRVQFSVEVQEALSANQYPEGNELVVEGIVRGSPPLDYCRLVRIDGAGFTTLSLPAGYSDSSYLNQGVCKIRAASPTILDHHPWTVVVKITGQDGELAQSTDHTLQVPPFDHDGPRATWWIYALVLLSVAAVVLLVAISFKRNRRWATERVAHMRHSLRKEPLHDQKPPLPA